MTVGRVTRRVFTLPASLGTWEYLAGSFLVLLIVFYWARFINRVAE